jgi:acetyl esterase/lipase
MDSATLVAALLSARTWTAFDVDEAGRVLAGHDDAGSLQLVEIAPEGTVRALTALPGRCSGRYVPGQRRVVVQHDQGGDERMQLSLLDLDEGPGLPAGLDDLTPLVHDPAHMHDLRDVTPGSVVYSTNRRNGVDMDVVSHDLVTGRERVVYDGGGYVAGAVADHAGRSVAVLRLSLQPSSTVVDVAGPEGVGPVTDPNEHALHELPAWTADDHGMLLASNHDRDLLAVQRLGLDGAWQVLVADDEHDLHCWVAPDGSAMLVGTLVDGAFTLAVHEQDGTRRCVVDVPAMAGLEARWSPGADRVVVSGTSPLEPGAIHLVDAATGHARLLASAASDLPEEVRDALTEPSVHRIPARDGEQVPCFRYAGAPGRAPASGASVVHIHGGPEGSADRVWHPVVQALAASGLTVLVPNVRGSTGYGKRWYSLDDVELRLESVADLADLHAWLPTQGLDPQRAALWGGSYGGYMVLAGLSMQPGLWAAGVDIVGMSSLVTFLENTSAYRRAFREREYGSLAHHRELLVRASPITYLDAVRAPLFVIHGANDPRVPLSEAEQIAAALTERGVPCELRVYHDEGHGLAQRANKLDAYPAAIAFLHRHLGQGADAGG